MKVYFVRHGESHGNAGTSRDQASRDVLTDKGWEQARQLGKRLADQSFSKIYVSPMERTVETAAAISEYVKAPLIQNNDIHELIWFTGQDGKIDPATARQMYIDHWKKLATLAPDQSIKNTESFGEIEKRVTRFLTKLENGNGDNPILVVTHGGFLRFILGLSLLRERFTVADLPNLMSTPVINTGISEFTWNTRKGWKLLTWMDQAHL